MSRYASWGIILDDIIYPDGQTSMGTLGGGGLFAACGMRLWQHDVAVNAAVGADFDASSLTPHGLDDGGLVVNDHPTVRAWQVLEEDGRRTQIPRVTPEDWFRQLVHVPVAQPISPTLKAIHFQGRGDAVEEKFIEDLAAAGVSIGAEPMAGADSTAEEIATMKHCMGYFTVFSPDQLGADVLVGAGPVKEQLRALAQLGPQIVALRQGKAGSLIYERESDRFWSVPAAKAQVVDVTGAGNAYCGGLLLGWMETGDVLQAAAHASVSAAFAIEQVGPPKIDDSVMEAARVRANNLLKLIEEGEK